MIRGACLVMIAWWSSGVQAQDSLAPFEDLRWDENTPRVQVEDKWWHVVSVDGVELDAILRTARREWPSAARRRFGEDLPMVMASLGQPIGQTAKLQLRPIEGGEPQSFDTAWSSEARNRIYEYQREEEVEHWLTDGTISADSLQWDLDELALRLEDQFAYLGWQPVDLDASLEKMTQDLSGPSTPVHEVVDALRGLLRQTGDAHSYARSWERSPPGAWLPIALVDSSAGVVAFGVEGLLDPKYPRVLAIEGRPIDDWLTAVEASADLGPASESITRLRLLREAADLEAVGQLVGWSGEPQITLTLGTIDRGDTRELSLPIRERRVRVADPDRGIPREIEPGILYVPIAQMDRIHAQLAHLAMDEMSAPQGLVLDVRGNGGGTREAVFAVVEALLPKAVSPRVVNVAAYRDSELFEDDHLEARMMYPLDHPGWSQKERQAMAVLLRDFAPEWDLDMERYSDWHAMVVSRDDTRARKWDRVPVVVLQDQHAFSATDIFLGAMREVPGVHHMGVPSGGGSARSQRFVLFESGIEVQVASMASFRPDGRLYDGRGIEVDELVWPHPSDLMGETDTVLERALAWLETAPQRAMRDRQ